MTRKKQAHLAYLVEEIRSRVTGAQLFMSLQEALQLAHQLQELPFATEYIRLQIEKVFPEVERLAGAYLGMNKKEQLTLRGAVPPIKRILENLGEHIKKLPPTSDP